MKWLIGLVIWVAEIIILTVVLDWLIVGFAIPAKLRKTSDRGRKEMNKSFIQKEVNRIDLQKSTECSGFSSAHVLRSFGIEAEGNEMYAKMPGKLKNGAVLPKNLKKLLQKYGFQVHFVRGNLDTLKEELSKGNRVIAFVKTRIDKKWLHYVPVVGYDEENVFIAESLRYLVNCKEEHYNRRVSKEEFLKYWDTRAWYMPFYKNTYLVIEKITSQVM